jgi:polyhydroxyalkanoate synthase
MDNGRHSNENLLAKQLEGVLEKTVNRRPRSPEEADNALRAAVVKITGGMSPIQVVLAYMDWLAHLALSPGKRRQLWESLRDKILELRRRAGDDGQPPPSAFSSAPWREAPFDLLAAAYLSVREWVAEASRGVSGVEEYHEELVAFINEQILEALSPANFPLTNPEVLATTRREKGANLLRGAGHLALDLAAKVSGDNRAKMGDYRVGENLATTPGKVIYRNELIELIQYSPTTEKVAKEPVLIVPAWVMKYYILDLSPHNSLVRYLVSQGKTVFMISWKNPSEKDRNLDLDQYLQRGLFEAVRAVRAVRPSARINAVGYCIGGTLLAIGAATLAREDDDTLNSISLFAAQVDFTEPGPINRMISQSQVAFLSSQMWADGYLDSDSMAASFMSLRSRELIWQPTVSRYYLGRDDKPNDLMAWNADGTRMPYKMHSRYLRELYLENRLAESKFEVDGKPVSLLDIRAPLFAVGTTTDHVAPWKSVFKINRLTQTEVTFLLTSGGHNAGIVSGPSHPRRQYQVATRKPGDKYTDPDTWVARQAVNQGSWWPEWERWLDGQCTSRLKPPRTGAAGKGYGVLCDAPGTYVFT